MFDESRPRGAWYAVAASLVVLGTLGTGLLPPELPFQIVAGGAVVAGFALVYYCLYEDES